MTIRDVVQVKAGDLAGNGLAPEGKCGLAVYTGCGPQISAMRLPSIPPPSRATDWPWTELRTRCALGCSLQTKGFTGDKQVVVAIEGDHYDPYACPMALIETRHFANGLLKNILGQVES